MTFIAATFSTRGASSPSTSVLVTWFGQRVATTLERARARALHAHTARLAATTFTLSTLPPRVDISLPHEPHEGSEIYLAFWCCYIGW